MGNPIHLATLTPKDSLSSDVALLARDANGNFDAVLASAITDAVNARCAALEAEYATLVARLDAITNASNPTAVPAFTAADLAVLLSNAPETAAPGGQLINSPNIVAFTQGKQTGTTLLTTAAFAAALTGLPTIEPITPGALWNNGGWVQRKSGVYVGATVWTAADVAIVFGELADAQPTTPHTPWNNGQTLFMTQGT